MSPADIARLREVVLRRNCLPWREALALLQRVEELERQVAELWHEVADAEANEDNHYESV